MPDVTTLAQESQRQTGFYAPAFEVRIGEELLSADVLRDVVQLTYRDNIREIDSFELTVNNWDAQTNDFKYVGSETRASLEGDTPQSRRYRLFEPGNKRVEIRMGYVGHRDDLRVMMTGELTSVEPNFPSGGAPTLTVRGLNALHTLRRKQYTTHWFDKRDSEIAQDIGNRLERRGGPRRFPLPIEIDREALNDEPVLPYVAQRNQYDIDFLLARARQRGYVVFIQEVDPHVRGSRRRLYFGPPRGEVAGLRNVTFELKWGQSLIEFRPTLTTANQVRAVQVCGWNRRTRERIRETVTLEHSRFDFNRDLIRLLPESTSHEEVVVNEPMFAPRQAQERALAVLTERFREMVTATGSTTGLPDLRAGQLVQIANVGSRFSGTYFITETTHTINDSGYTTRFTVRREDTGGSGR